MNITELARQVRVPTKDLRVILPEMGFDIGGRAIKVDNKVAQQVIKTLSNKANREKYLKLLQTEEEIEPDNDRERQDNGEDDVFLFDHDSFLRCPLLRTGGRLAVVGNGGNRVKPGTAPRMTAAQSVRREIGPPGGPVNIDGLDGVFRTGRQIAAAGREKRRYGIPVEQNRGLEQH